MTIKIIWGLIGLNLLALLVFAGAFLVSSQGRNVDFMEKGWTAILAGLGLVVILLAALPLRYSHSTFAVIFSGFFAALPSLVLLGIYLSNVLPSLGKPKMFAETYYKDETGRSIAAAIEQNDTNRLKELIRGQDMNARGVKMGDWEGLNYLQFAIRVRSNPASFPYNEVANTAAIRILVEHGTATTPALVDAVQYLPVEMVSLFLDAGADPNIRSPYNNEPLLAGTMGTSKEQNDKAILLAKRGADVNAKASNGYTPVMYAANNARTSVYWNDVWRVVRFLITEAHADYTYADKEGNSLQSILRRIREEAAANRITMPPDFGAVVAWLKEHDVDTEPVATVK